MGENMKNKVRLDDGKKKTLFTFWISCTCKLNLYEDILGNGVKWY